MQNRTQTHVYKDHLASLDIVGFQAATVEMVLKVKKAMQVPLDHVVRRGKVTGTGNNALGGRAIVVILGWYRFVVLPLPKRHFFHLRRIVFLNDSKRLKKTRRKVFLFCTVSWPAYSFKKCYELLTAVSFWGVIWIKVRWKLKKKNCCCRIVSSPNSRITLLSALFTREM